MMPATILKPAGKAFRSAIQVRELTVKILTRAAGPWWADYHLSIEPVGGTDKPQTGVLQDAIPIPEPVLKVRKIPPRNDVGFTLLTRYGFLYQPQASLNLESSASINFGNSLTGNAQVMAVSARTSSNAHQFFRVQVNRLP